jgi:arsenite/tail-anchored protein-transporting ATPase
VNPLALGSRQILFVGGKGGVGKTTVASALALRLSEAGERVLLVSTDPAHSLGDLFDARIGNREVALHPGLFGLEIDPDAEVERYLASVKANMRTLVRPAMYSEVERQIELTRHSPGAAEAALMDRMAELMDEGPERYDRVIFDTAPTGHTLRLLTLPEIMAAWTEGLLRSRDRSEGFGRALERLTGRKPGGFGGTRESAGMRESGDPERPANRPGDELSMIDPVKEPEADGPGSRIREVLLERRRKFSRARRLLLDPKVTAFVLVLVPEKLPILESRKALDVLREHRVPVVGLVVNRVLPAEHEGASLGAFLESRREQEEAYLQRIDRDFATLPRVRVPLMPRDVEGVESLRALGKHLQGGGES